MQKSLFSYFKTSKSFDSKGNPSSDSPEIKSVNTVAVIEEHRSDENISVREPALLEVDSTKKGTNVDKNEKVLNLECKSSLDPSHSQLIGDLVEDEVADADYDKFLEMENERIAKEEAIAIENARRENERKSNDEMFALAMRVIQSSISKAEEYERSMSLTESKYSDSQLFLDKQPPLLTGGELRDYQLKGFQWISRHAFTGESMILADEMGLGKTIQVIAFLAWQAQYLPGNVMIICPLSTLGNWMNEIQRFAPSLVALRYHGTAAYREELRNRFLNPEFMNNVRAHEEGKMTDLNGNSTSARTSKSSKSSKPLKSPSRSKAEKSPAVNKSSNVLPIVVTTYEVAARDAAFLSPLGFKTLVIDEGHRLKNDSGAVRSILTTYSRHCANQVRLLLTGTPVQNDLSELWSLCNFIMPAVFRSKAEFQTIYQFVGIGTKAGAEYLQAQERKHAIVSQLHTLLGRYLLRRTKGDVKKWLRLPPKVETLVFTPLVAAQVRILRALVKGNVADELKAMGWVASDRQSSQTLSRVVNARSAASTSLTDAQQSGITRSDKVVEAAVKEAESQLPQSISTHNLQMNLRKVCVHPYFFAEPPVGTFNMSNSESLDNKEEMKTGIKNSKKTRFFHSENPTSFTLKSKFHTPIPHATADTDEGIVSNCGKMLVLDKMLHELKARGHKVLIFSQFTRVLAMLQDYFSIRPGLGEYRVLEGNTPAEERDKYILEFNSSLGNGNSGNPNEIFAFLLSTRAGGLGINLVAADTVIFYDSDWNPKSDEQAQDRAHRIGQTRPVVVYRLVTAGASVERRMLRVAGGKNSLGRVVLQEGKFLMQAHSESEKNRSEDSEDGKSSMEEKKEEIVPKLGKCDEKYLEYWLRLDLDERENVDEPTLPQMNDMKNVKKTKFGVGISDEELSVILDRNRAVQAGRRVAMRVESIITGEVVDDNKRMEEDTSTRSSKHQDNPTSEVSDVAKGAIDWDSYAVDNVPYTPSNGDGYEFVYHQTSRGFLGSDEVILSDTPSFKNEDIATNAIESGSSLKTQEFLEKSGGDSVKNSSFPSVGKPGSISSLAHPPASASQASNITPRRLETPLVTGPLMFYISDVVVVPKKVSKKYDSDSDIEDFENKDQEDESASEGSDSSSESESDGEQYENEYLPKNRKRIVRKTGGKMKKARNS